MLCCIIKLAVVNIQYCESTIMSDKSSTGVNGVHCRYTECTLIDNTAGNRNL